MPRVNLRIDRIDDTSVTGSPRFLVTGDPTDGSKGSFTVLTFDPWRASLCERAKTLGVPVDLVWKDGRYGKEIVAVSIQDATTTDPIRVGDRGDLFIGRNQLSNESEYVHVKCAEIFEAPDGVRRVRFQVVGGGLTNVPRWESWPSIVRDYDKIRGLIASRGLVLQSQFQEIAVKR